LGDGLAMPKELTHKFKEQVAEYEEGQKMRYITSVERLIMEERMQLGVLQNARENVPLVLQTRFQNVSLPESMVQTVNSINDSALLDYTGKALHRHSILVESLNKFSQELVSVTNAQYPKGHNNNWRGGTKDALYHQYRAPHNGGKDATGH